MLQQLMNSNVTKTVYQVVLPAIVVLSLLGIASFNSRPQLLGAASIDFIIRLVLTFWFCGLFVKLSRFSSFSFFPNKQWTESDVRGMEKYFYIGIGFLFSIGCGVLTWWVSQWFLSIHPGIAFVMAVLNCIIVFLPIATNYWVLKL